MSIATDIVGERNNPGQRSLVVKYRTEIIHFFRETGHRPRRQLLISSRAPHIAHGRVVATAESVPFLGIVLPQGLGAVT